jgi:hypothetical protein
MMARVRSSAKRSYRKKVANSQCKGLKASQCRNSKTCKLAIGKKRSFCRKIKNQHRNSYKKRVMKKKSLSNRSSSGSSMKTLTPRSSYKTPRSSSKKQKTRKINKRVDSLYKKIRGNH